MSFLPVKILTINSVLYIKYITYIQTIAGQRFNKAVKYLSTEVLNIKTFMSTKYCIISPFMRFHSAFKENVLHFY